MTENKLPFLLLTLMLMATLTEMTASVQGFLGGTPVPYIFKDDPDNPDLLTCIEVHDLEVNKGIVEASDNDRFFLIISGNGTVLDPVGIEIISVQIEPHVNEVDEADDAELRKGNTVKVAPVVLPIPNEKANAINDALIPGGSVIFQVEIELCMHAFAWNYVYDVDDQGVGKNIRIKLDLTYENPNG